MEPSSDLSARLAVKTAPPQPHAAYLRDDQIARVADAEAQLILVRAPAGYGKTSLVAEAADKLGWKCVWYRLDSSDEDPASFLASLASAVRLRRPELAKALPAASAQFGDPAGSETTAADFARALAELKEHLCLVLDDYDALESTERFDQAMAALLQLLPLTLRLVVLGRRRPGFASVKLELDGELVEITHHDLLLAQDQIVRIVEQQGGVTPSREAVEELLAVTEGWAAAVVLAAKAARWLDPLRLHETLCGRDFERALFPYLAEEVFARQPAEIRQFLTSTCFLEPITSALAEAVTGSPGAERLLNHLHEREVLAFTGPSGDALRYHPLFRRFLQASLLAREGADGFRALQRASADALAAHGFLERAVELYLALGAPEAPLALLERDGAGLLDQCGDALLREWVDALRESSGADSSWAALVEGRRLFRRGHLASAREQLESAHAALGSGAAGRYVSHQALARHLYLTGADEEAVGHARRALEAAAGRRQEAESLLALARTLSSTCRWDDLDAALAAFDALGDAPPKLVAEMAQLEIQRAYVLGDVRAAFAAAEHALPLVRRHGTSEEVGSSLNALAALSLCQARYVEAAAHLVQARKACDAHGLTKAAAEVELTQAALLAQGDELAAALAALDRLLETDYARGNPAALFEAEGLRGTLLRRADRLEDAEEAYERAGRALESAGTPYDKLATRLDLAYTRFLRSGDPQASSKLRQLMDEAARTRLLSQYAKARLYLAIIAGAGDGTSDEELASPCEELIRLGHLDFLGQELAAAPHALGALLTADMDEGARVEALAAVASQSGGPAKLASLAEAGEGAGLLVVEAVGRSSLPAQGRLLLLAELRHHRSKRVRDRSRRVLLIGSEGRLFPELTPREEEILAVLAAGGSNRDIAEELSLTLSTVKTHVHRILTKIEVRGRLAAAVAYQQRAAR